MTLTTLSSSLPALRLSAAAVPLSRLAASSLAIGGARRAYWSFRCARRSPYQYWITASPGQKAWQRRGTMGSGASFNGRDKRGEKAGGSQDPKEKVEEESSKDRENRVQADEQRFLAEEWAEWEKAARRHADARLDLLRRAMERDPYSVFFGAREARGVWNPWRYGIGTWGKMLERWNQKSRSLTEYVEERGGDLAKRWDDVSEPKNSVNKTVRDDEKLGEAKVTSHERAPSTVRKTERKDGRTIETEETKMKDGRTIRMRETEERNGRTIRTETTETSQSTTIPSVQSGDVHIDLITMRKVQRITPIDQPITTPPSAPQPGSPKQPKKDEALDIPIKTYSKSQNAADKTIAGFASKEWLKREGFSARESANTSETSRPSPRKPESPAAKAVYVSPLAKQESASALPVPQTQSTRIQTALDRWNRKTSLPTTAEEKSTSLQERSDRRLASRDGHESIKDQVAYEPKEVTTDDVDLLRASDIRAASGKVKEREHQVSALEVAERRSVLASKFDESQRRIDRELREEIIDALKNNSIPTKSPLWALWMLYDQAGREDYSKWLHKGTFHLNDPQELKDMQYLSRAFFDQMPSPKEIFASRGSSLSRYIDANRASLALNNVQDALDRWHMEMQSALVPRGVQPFSPEVLDNVRKAFRKYHIELRRQILSGTGPQVIKTRDPREQLHREAAEKLLAKEVETTRAAMQMHEEKHSSINQTDGKTDFVQWKPPGLPREEDARKAAAEVSQGARLSLELRKIYEAEYGKITPNHRQPAPKNEASPVFDAKEAKSKPAQERDAVGQRIVWDEAELAKPEVSTPRVSSTLSTKPEVSTILLTLGRRNGDLTTHPTAQWPVLKSQPTMTSSPLDSPAVCAFLQVASDPQQVLREVVHLQAKGYRLTSGRKGCLIFQQVPSLNTNVMSEAKESTKATPVVEAPQTTSNITEEAFFAPIEAETDSITEPLNEPTSEPKSTPIPSATSNETPLSRPYTSPTFTSPSPSQPIRRAEAVFSGRPVSSAAAADSASSSASSSTPPPPPPPPSYINNHHYYRSPRRSSRRHARMPRRRFRHAIAHVLRTALFMAAAAYVAGLWLEWRRERARFAARYGPEALRAMERTEKPGLWERVKEEVGRSEDAVVRWVGRERVEKEREEARAWWADNATATAREQR